MVTFLCVILLYSSGLGTVFRISITVTLVIKHKIPRAIFGPLATAYLKGALAFMCKRGPNRMHRTV